MQFLFIFSSSSHSSLHFLFLSDSSSLFSLLFSVCLNQHTLGPQDRLLAFCDKNKDLYLGYLAGSTGSSGYVGSTECAVLPSSSAA